MTFATLPAVVKRGQIPAGQRDLLDGCAGNGRIDQIAATYVNPDVRVAGESENVPGLQVLKRYRRQLGHLVVADSRNRDSRVRPRRHRQAGAVVARAARAGGAVDVRAADLAVGILDGRVRT